jgi:hypothetical protein
MNFWETMVKNFVGLKLFACAVAGVAWLSIEALAAGSCHIHPLGIEMKETQPRIIDWYDSLEECEMANKKFYGGRGMCHCFSDGPFDGRGDDWRSWNRNFGVPEDQRPN